MLFSDSLLDNAFACFLLLYTTNNSNYIKNVTGDEKNSQSEVKMFNYLFTSI